MSDFVENVSLKLETYQELIKRIGELEKEVNSYALFKDNILMKVEKESRIHIGIPITISEFVNKIKHDDFSISLLSLQTPTGGAKVNIVIEMEVGD